MSSVSKVLLFSNALKMFTAPTLVILFILMLSAFREWFTASPAAMCVAVASVSPRSDSVKH